MREFDILGEPRDETYRGLLRAATPTCSRLSVVVRDDQPANESCRDALRRLEPFLVEEQRVSAWPGTVLHAGEASLRTYVFNEATCGALEDLAEGLYDWQQPHLPEDLCLYRVSGDTWLTSIAHERDAFLKLTDDEMEDVVRLNPKLALSRDPQASQLFTWGDEVCVRDNAPALCRPGSRASVVGGQEIEGQAGAGVIRYVVEFQDGQSVEVDGTWLEQVEVETP